MKSQNNGNNGNNGDKYNYKGIQKDKVKYTAICLRADLVDKLRVLSIEKKMTYSDYVESLIEQRNYDQVFSDPQNREVMKALLTRLGKQVNDLAQTGGFKW